MLLRMAYRRLHIAAGNCLPPGWQEETNESGEPAPGGVRLNAGIIDGIVCDFFDVKKGRKEIDVDDVVTAIAVWSWQMSNGATHSELRRRIADVEDYRHSQECNELMDLLVANVGLIVNQTINPYLISLGKKP